MDWKLLTIDDKETIDGFTKNKFETCDFNFTNLFLWSAQEQTAYRISDDGDTLCVRSNYEGELYYYMPVSMSGSVDNIKREAAGIAGAGGHIILVPEKWRLLLGDENFLWQETRNSFDYVYNYEDLANLPGRKYSKKKNRIHHFEANYPGYQYVPITERNIGEVIMFQEEWCYDKSCFAQPILESENTGIHNLLRNFGKLDYKGACLTVDDQIVCYTLGEAITDEYVVIHIEKGINDYIGSYQMINKLFLEKEFSGCKYVNREDDFGDEGLREAKTSYHPAFLLKKYEILGVK